MKKRRVPSYYIVRMFIFPLVLYTLLTLPVLVNLLSSNIMELIENGTIPVDIVNNIIELQEKDFVRNEVIGLESHKELINNTLLKFVYIQLIILAVYILFNSPFRVFLKKQKKGKTIKKNLDQYCRFFLHKTPLINSLLFLGGLFIAQMNLIKFFGSEADNNLLSVVLFRQLFILSIVASLLTAIFIFSWQKYRVQMKYIDSFFSEEKLKKRIGRLTFSNMRSKLFVSSLMTTFLPLLLLVFYIFLNVSSIQIQSINEDSSDILMGEFLEILSTFDLKEGFFQLMSRPETSTISHLYYIDVTGFIRLIWGFANGITVSMIYIFFFLKWTNSSITKPINDIVREMKNTSKGKFGSYTIVRTKDEIGKLGEGFNTMVDGLKEREKIKSLFGQYLTREISDEILNGRVDLGGELYDATILFADIRNFTSISEKMSPREVVDFLNSYLSGMIDVIIENNGIIDKFMGDGILAVFGVPVSTKDHAESGIKAALAMNESLRQQNKLREKEGLFPIKIGIGVHSGPVIGGNLGNNNKLEYTVIGDTVNVASRIENLTKRYKSSLIISGTTYQILSREMKKKINMKAIANAEIRGKEKPLTLYSMVSG